VLQGQHFPIDWVESVQGSWSKSRDSALTGAWDGVVSFPSGSVALFGYIDRGVSDRRAQEFIHGRLFHPAGNSAVVLSPFLGLIRRSIKLR
jgi:hypothetical protein